jgi:hypothetical protein
MNRLDDILLEAGVLTEDQVKKVRQEKTLKGQGIAGCLIHLGFITEDDLIKTLSRKLRLPILDLTQIEIPEKILTLFPSDALYEHILVPVAMKKIGGKKNLIVAMSDPTDDQTQTWLKKYIPYKVRPGIASERMIKETLKRHKVVSRFAQEGSEGSLEERTESVSIRVNLNEEEGDGEPTQLNRIDGNLKDEDEAVLRGLTEPSFHGTQGEIPRVEDLESSNTPENRTNPENALKRDFAKEEVSQALENLPLPVIWHRFDQNSNKNDLLEVIIQLLIERKLVSLEELQELISRMKK